ncbi:uncharacterized protein LOC125550798 [Triticum urartu]|uniref:uncharacterized protein LOC125550798 n=1 Tax=Triticum urartu TaxID=4572 RepID=UPI002044771D|nr:uncharacterized protein LOC125550798 [Triticum urartu]
MTWADRASPHQPLAGLPLAVGHARPRAPPAQHKSGASTSRSLGGTAGGRRPGHTAQRRRAPATGYDPSHSTEPTAASASASAKQLHLMPLSSALAEKVGWSHHTPSTFGERAAPPPPPPAAGNDGSEYRSWKDVLLARFVGASGVARTCDPGGSFPSIPPEGGGVVGRRGGIDDSWTEQG